MKCSFCGAEFDPQVAEIACGSCPLIKGCALVRCPRCGYETPPEAKLLRWLRSLQTGRGKEVGASRKEYNR